SCGGPTTVGLAANFGLSLRTTTAGGVICSRANLGGDPLEAESLSPSPPPPPPPERVADDGRMYGLTSVTMLAICCLISWRCSTNQWPDQTIRAVNRKFTA